MSGSLTQVQQCGMLGESGVDGVGELARERSVVALQEEAEAKVVAFVTGDGEVQRCEGAAGGDR
jgi:hypothetical protein